MNSTELVASYLDARVSVLVGNIAAQRVDAIVNAANSTLLGGGGVDGAIHAAGGPQILAECRALRSTEFPKGLPTGKAVMTGAGRLPARYVIHTVGPIKGRDEAHEADQLAACYSNSLELAVVHNLSTIAFPSISTGAYGYPKHLAAAIASCAITSVLLRATAISEVRLVFFSSGDAQSFVRHQRFPDA
jgi:O-acetyl-ADP-ribose deacetylase